ncbi:MAG: SLC13 family permease [Acidobacteria bacterium]|nr:MAG: SLC13 family permease [Acidobacteriota bacterium]
MPLCMARSPPSRRAPAGDARQGRARLSCRPRAGARVGRIRVTLDIGIVLAVVSLAFLLFLTEVLPVELVGVLALVALVLTGVVDPNEAFQGFGSPALVMIACVLVLSSSLVRNGAGERIAARIERLSGTGPEKMILALLASVTGISAFINNVAATAMYLPVAENLARTYRVPPSRLLMPVAYASLLGGVCTLTGTSTNVAVSGGLEAHGMKPLGIFELSWVGVPLAVVGLVYLLVVSRWIPGRAAEEAEPENGDSRQGRLFLTELEVPEGSPAIGRTLRELALAENYELSPIGLIRGAVRLAEDVLDTPLKEGDVVVVEGTVHAINRGVAAAGLRRKKSSKVTPPGQGALALVEGTISYNSPLIGRTLREVDLRGRYGLDVIALWRRGGPLVEKIGHIRLRIGDDLLIQGPIDRIRSLAGDPLYLLLNDRVLPRYEPRKELLSVLAFAGALLLGASGIVPIALAFVLGALAVILTGCMTVEEAYRAVNFKLILIVGSMFGVATAIEESGTAAWMAQSMLEALGGAGARPLMMLAGLYWLTVLLTQSMSNAAAALLVLPIGLSSAELMGIAVRPVAVTIAVAASLAFMTPLEPACLLVMSTGRYRFADFMKFGAPLSVVCFLIVMLLVPLFYPY